VREDAVRVRRAGRVLWRRAGTEVLAALPDGTDVRRLSGSAAAVWALLDDPRSVPEVVRELVAVYEMPAEDVAGPVTGCVDELVHLGLVDELRDPDG